MAVLTLLLVVHDCLMSSFIPYHKLRYDTAVAHGRLIEILAELNGQIRIVNERSGK